MDWLFDLVFILQFKLSVVTHDLSETVATAEEAVAVVETGSSALIKTVRIGWVG